MIVVNWNIRWGGNGKEKAIVEKIKGKTPDLIVLTEYKNNRSGNQIKFWLKEIGYNHCLISSKDINKNGVGIFSKQPIESIKNAFVDKENVSTFRYLGYAFITTFCSDDAVTARFVENIVNLKIEPYTIIIGDLNTGPRGSRPNRYEDLDRIVNKGFVDIWRYQKREICWSYQSEKGRSQPDHVLCTPDILSKNCQVNFDLSTIQEGISDHGIMVFEFAHAENANNVLKQ